MILAHLCPCPHLHLSPHQIKQMAQLSEKKNIYMDEEGESEYYSQWSQQR